MELDLVFRGTGLHGEVAVCPHGHKVVLLGLQVGVDNHAVTPDYLSTKVHHVHWGQQRDRPHRTEAHLIRRLDEESSLYCGVF